MTTRHDINATREGVAARMVEAVGRRLGCAVVFIGQRLPDGSRVADGVADGRAVSVFGVPADKIEAARALGLTVEVAGIHDPRRDTLHRGAQSAACQ